MELPDTWDFMDPLPLNQPWAVKIQRRHSPSAFVVTENNDVIVRLELDSGDCATGADVLRHLVECHNYWVKERARKRN